MLSYVVERAMNGYLIVGNYPDATRNVWVARDEEELRSVQDELLVALQESGEETTIATPEPPEQEDLL